MANSVLAKMAVQISANTAEFNKALTSTSNNLKSFTSNITNIAGAVGIAFGVQQVASFALEVSKLAGQAEAVEAAFRRLSDSETLMKRLKEATGGTVSELELMKRAVMASNFDISLEALPRLLQFATLRAQQTGQSVDYLVDSIVTGIGRKSKLILDNLGISAAQLNEQLKGVSTEAATVGEVAEAVGRIAEKNLVDMAGFSENAATKIQRLSANWENLKVAIGEAANGTGVLGTSLNFLNGILENLTKTFADPSIEQYIKAAKELKDLRQQAASRGDLEEWERINMFLEQALDKIRAYKISNEQATKSVATNNDKVAETEKKINLTLLERLALYDRMMKAAPEATSSLSRATLPGFKDDSLDLRQGFLQGIGGELEPPDISRFAETAENVKTINQQLAESWDSLAASAIVGMAEAFGGGENIGQNLLRGLSNFGKRFGAQIVAIGTAKVAEGIMTKNPKAVAEGLKGIAAGAALVGVSAAIGSSASGGGGSAGSGGSGISGSRGSQLATNAAQNEFSYETAIRGQDLYVIFSNYEKNKKRTSTIGG